MLNTRQALDKFGKGTVKQARTNLTKKGKNVSKELYNSINYELAVGKNSFSITINMEDYGKFQDEGVKGADPSLVNGVQKAPNSPYSYKSKFPPIKPIREWVKAKGLKLRDEQGRFKKGGAKTLAYLISRSIYAQGIKPSRFFSRAFETQFDNLPVEVVEAFNLDLDDLLEFSRK